MRVTVALVASTEAMLAFKVVLALDDAAAAARAWMIRAPAATRRGAKG